MNEIKTIYCPPDEETFYRLCSKHKVNYINIREDSKGFTGNCSNRYEWEKENNLVFHNSTVTIHQIDSKKKTDKQVWD